MSTQQDINVIRAQRLANTHDPLALMENTQTSFHPDHSSLITYIQHSQPNNNFVPQPSFNTNYMQQPMQNLKDILKPTTALDMALELMAKAFQLNNTTPTNNNQTNSSNPCYRQIAQSVQNQGIQNVGNQNGLSVVPKIANQHGNGNVIAAWDDGNSNGINRNPITCYNCQGGDHYASNCTTKPRKQDASYLQKQMQIAQKEEAGIQLTSKESDFMAAAGACKETERDNANCTLENNLQQASTSGVFVSQKAKSREESYFLNTSKTANVSKSFSIPNEEFSDDTTPSVARKFLNEVKITIVTLQRVVKQKMTLDIHNWPSSTHPEIHKIVKDEIFPIVNQVDARVLNLKIQFLKKAAKFVRDFKSLAKKADEYLAKHKALELKIERLLRAVVSQDIMSVVQNNSVVDSSNLQTELERKPPFSGSKLYYVTPFPKSSVLPKVDKTNSLSKTITSNSAPSIRESKGVQTVNVIAPIIFRTNHSKTSRVDNVFPNEPVKASVRTKPITVSQPHVITKNNVNSKTNGLSPKDVRSTTKTRRPLPKNSPKNDKQCLIIANHDVCVLNHVNGINSHGKKQKENVSNIANQTEHKAQVWKSKNVGSKERLASPKPRKPRSCLRWSPNGRIFNFYGKIIATTEPACRSDCSKGDNACTSNPQEPISRRFPNSTFSMTGGQNWFNTLLIPLLFEYKPMDKEDHGDNECDT
nr:hypothetical protein [Tanacetum cinerariifolium]